MRSSQWQTWLLMRSHIEVHAQRRLNLTSVCITRTDKQSQVHQAVHVFAASARLVVTTPITASC